MKRFSSLFSLLTLTLVLLLFTASCAGKESEASSVSSSASSSSLSSSSSSVSSSSSSSSAAPEEYRRNQAYVPADITPDDTLAEKLRQAEQESDSVVAWVSVPGMEIDYPVAQGEDNDYYLSHSYTGEESKNGSIYAHYHNDLSDPYNLPDNTVLFGHNMWIYNDEMFTTLEDFYEQDFANEHRYFTLTVGDVTTYWVIYAVFDTEIAQGEGQYDFYYWNTYSRTEEEWQDVQDQIFERSLYDYGDAPQYGENTLLLSTCSYHYKNWLGFLRDDVRLVVAARLLREGETVTDLADITENTDRRTPA